MDTAIRLSEVSKRFRKDDGRAPLIGVIRGALAGESVSAWRASIDGLSLAIDKGEKVGLIGSNGAGKTTLLKLIAGLYPPSAGTVEVNGRVVFLAGFGTGMLGELTVVENAILYAAIYGLSRQALAGKLDEIISWAGLDEFRNTLFKHLSAGMKVRLAFSVYRYFKADVFLMDEALSAGDQVFRKKCQEVLAGQRDSDQTMVIASHSNEFIEEFCSRTIWIEQGRLCAFGATEDVVAEYRQQAEAPAI